MFGPPPSWDEYRQIGAAAIAARLIDPESARITWLTGYRQGDIKPFLNPRVTGYVACGSVNARNRLGGYVGASVFVVVIDYGRALFADMDRTAGGTYETSCTKALATGLYPPPPGAGGSSGRSAASQSSARPGSAGSTELASLANAAGLSLRTMPEGAYIAGVTAGSPAAMAGLKPGMVITSVNAIPLAGMGEAMGKMVDAAGPGATLTLVGGTTIKLGGGK